MNGQTSFWGSLNKGDYNVGFTTFALSDSSRGYGKGARPILLSLWFPQEAAEGTRVTFEDYLATEARKLRLAPLSAQEKRAAMEVFVNKISKRGAQAEDIRALTKQVTMASRGELNPTALPLIFVLQGGGRPAYTQFVLNEYLASHGYLVVSLADLKHSPNRSHNSSEKNSRAMSVDIDFVLNYLETHFNHAFEAKAAIAFSKAGEAVLLNQSSQQQFQALVMLDAQPGAETQEYLTTSMLSTIQAPTLAIFSNHQKKLSWEEALEDSKAFEDLNANRLKIRLMDANHGDLTVAAILGDMVPGFNRWPSIGQARLSYESLCRFTLIFLNQYLKHIPGEDRVKQHIAKLPPEFLVMHPLRK